MHKDYERKTVLKCNKFGVSSFQWIDRKGVHKIHAEAILHVLFCGPGLTKSSTGKVGQLNKNQKKKTRKPCYYRDNHAMPL